VIQQPGANGKPAIPLAATETRTCSQPFFRGK
jgi:hypothetical protein